MLPTVTGSGRNRSACFQPTLALGGPLKEGNADEYLRLAKKKFSKLQRAAESTLSTQQWSGSRSAGCSRR